MPGQSSKTKNKKKVSKKSSDTKKSSEWTSRAALRLVEAGSTADCTKCEEPISYKARQREMQVICNIYQKSVWQKVEHYHQDCYKKSKKPYGDPIKK